MIDPTIGPKRDTLNNDFYNTFVDTFDKIPFEDVLPELFLKHVTKESEILEIGSGAGALALWMQGSGHKVTCIEPAEKAAEKARGKKLNVVTTRFQDFDTQQKFDSIVAISSLIHIPISEMPLQIKRIYDFLHLNGIFIFSFIEGKGEGCEDPTKKGKERFFSKFSASEMDELLNPYFSTLYTTKVEVEVMNKTFIIMVLKKLEQKN